ncbi:MAG TPA: SPOR domain-containing protein [Candidatus Aquilonibacter sp.]|nr:SPOR domain-containing protein [Candidatus Aquilonibacter sp.]
MARNGKGGGDRVLESRHLIGLFLGVVLLCGVFFTLGYVMGRTQYDGAVHAESISREPAPQAAPAPGDADAQPAAVPAAAASGEWDFSKKSDVQNAVIPAPPKTPEEVSDSTPAATVEKPAPPAPIPARVRQPSQSARLARDSILLQVAALRHESDAIEMARLLQQKRFPAFVSPLGGDKLYHVQVGPYTDEHSADAARATLDHDGFKAIVKR